MQLKKTGFKAFSRNKFLFRPAVFKQPDTTSNQNLNHGNN